MRGMVPPDPETDVSQLRIAVVSVSRRNRKRFPAGCVEIFQDEGSARTAASKIRTGRAARVVGPSKSSEGQYLYYLHEWLD